MLRSLPHALVSPLEAEFGNFFGGSPVYYAAGRAAS